MPLIIPTSFGIVAHALTVTGDADPMFVTYGVSVNPGGVTDADAMANGLHDAYFAAVGGQLATAYTLQSTLVRWRAGVGTELSEVLHVEPKVFTGTSSPLPQNCALLIHKYTSTAGRRGKGRFFQPGVAEGEVGSSGLVDSTRTTALNTSMATWLTSIATQPDIDGMVLLHSTGISGAPDPTPVTSLICDPLIATQRRRLRR